MAEAIPWEELLSGADPHTINRILTDPTFWAETFLVNPTGGEFRANHVQTRILGSTKRFNAIRVHRRAGKSYSIAVLSLFYCLMMESCQVLIITPAGSQVKELFTTIRDFMRVNEWMADHVTRNHENPHRIEFTNGSRISGFTTGARSKGKGVNLRGQGADVIFVDEAAYLNEDDWVAIKPIMKGDKFRRQPPRVFVCSTPAYTRGTYYRMCKELSQSNPENKKPTWHEIHVGVTDNPDNDEEYIQQAKELASNELEWHQEWLAEFPDLGEGVFPKHLVDKSLVEYHLEELIALARDWTKQEGVKRPPSRTMGVDWDKHNEDGHGPNIVILELTPEGKYRVVHWEEIPQSKMSLTYACDRIVELDQVFDCEWIYVDMGFGEMQWEELQKRGLEKKVQGIYFQSMIQCPLPNGGVQKKRFKQAMVSLLRTWFERGLLELPKAKKSLWNQFNEYHIVSYTETTIKFSTTNEHGIDATGLAAMAMHQRVKNPYAPKRATQVHVVKAPQPVPANLIKEGMRNGKTPLQTWDALRTPPDTFSRRTLGNCGPGSRTMF